MFDDDTAYDNPGGTFGGSNYSPTGSTDNDPGTGFNTLGNRYSTTWLEPKPFGAQSGWQTNAQNWIQRDTDPPGGSQTLEVRGPDALDGPTRHLTMGDIAHLPESRQYMMIKTSATPSSNTGTGSENTKPSTAESSGGAQNSGREEFQHGGVWYSKENGRTYMFHPELPGGVQEVHPDRAAEIDRQRMEERDRLEKDRIWREEQAQRDAEKWRRPTEEEAKEIEKNDRHANYAAGTIGGFMAGYLPVIGKPAGIALPGIVAYSLDNSSEFRTKGNSIPVFEKMTPEEIADYYGRP